MNTNQIQRRQEIMERLWAVEDNAQSLEAPEVLAAAEVDVREMEPLVQELDESGDTLEVGRTWRYLGDACFRLSGKKVQHALQKGRRAYLQAEPLLETAGDQEELAKLNFNLANTIRLIDDGRNRALMEEAKRRYYKSLIICREVMPTQVPSVESSLQSIEIALRGLDLYEVAEQGFKQTEELKKRLEQAGPNPAPDLLASVQRALEQEKGPAEVIQEFRAFIDRTSSLLSPAGSDSQQDVTHQEIRDTLDALARELPAEERQEAEETDALFDQAYAVLEKAGESGEITEERQETLHAILKEFEALAKQEARTPVDMTIRAGRMRELINRYKHIFTDQ